MLTKFLRTAVSIFSSRNGRLNSFLGFDDIDNQQRLQHEKHKSNLTELNGYNTSGDDQPAESVMKNILEFANQKISCDYETGMLVLFSWTHLCLPLSS
jgi:hypothetical protein